MIWFFVGAALFVAMLCGAYWLWARKIAIEVAEGSAVEWERLKERDPALVEGLDKARFDTIYARVHFPRFPKYALAALAGFVASLPITLALLFAILWIAEKLRLTPEAKALANHYLVEKGHLRLLTGAAPDVAYYYLQDLGGFYYFIGVLAVWLVIVGFVMRRYHQRRPGHLRDEIIRAGR